LAPPPAVLALQRFPQRHGIRSAAGSMRSMERSGSVALKVGDGMEKEIQPYHALLWVNYNDLTTTSLDSWLVREIIPKWP